MNPDEVRSFALRLIGYERNVLLVAFFAINHDVERPIIGRNDRFSVSCDAHTATLARARKAAMDDEPKDREPRDSQLPPEERDRRHRGRLEGVIPELLKRAVEIGVEKASEAPESLRHLVSDLRLPKEVATYLLTQVEDTKNGALRVVAKETRDFLEHTNLAHEIRKMLTTLQFEINTTVRFRPNEPKEDTDDNADEGDDSMPKPEVKLDVFARRHDNKKKKAKEG